MTLGTATKEELEASSTKAAEDGTPFDSGGADTEGAAASKVGRRIRPGRAGCAGGGGADTLRISCDMVRGDDVGEVDALTGDWNKGKAPRKEKPRLLEDAAWELEEG